MLWRAEPLLYGAVCVCVDSGVDVGVAVAGDLSEEGVQTLQSQGEITLDSDRWTCTDHDVARRRKDERLPLKSPDEGSISVQVSRRIGHEDDGCRLGEVLVIQVGAWCDREKGGAVVTAQDSSSLDELVCRRRYPDHQDMLCAAVRTNAAGGKTICAAFPGTLSHIDIVHDVLLCSC